MLLRRTCALDNLKKTLHLIDEDQRLALLHAPFKGTTLFGGELAKHQEANTEQAITFTVFPMPTAPLSLITLKGRILVFLTEGAQEGLVVGAES